MDAVVAKPYGMDSKARDVNNSMLLNLENKLFPELYKLLNHHFDYNYSERSWKIILGPYLRAVIKLLLNRINTLKQCLESRKLLELLYINQNIAH